MQLTVTLEAGGSREVKTTKYEGIIWMCLPLFVTATFRHRSMVAMQTSDSQAAAAWGMVC